MTIETIDIQNTKGMQAINIPADFKIDDDKVYIKKVGNAIYLIPCHNPWQNLFDSLGTFSEDFMTNRDQSVSQQRESFD